MPLKKQLTPKAPIVLSHKGFPIARLHSIKATNGARPEILFEAFDDIKIDKQSVFIENNPGVNISASIATGSIQQLQIEL